MGPAYRRKSLFSLPHNAPCGAYHEEERGGKNSISNSEIDSL